MLLHAHGWFGSPPDRSLVQSKRNLRVDIADREKGGSSRQGLAGLSSNPVMLQQGVPESVAVGSGCLSGSIPSHSHHLSPQGITQTAF